MKKKSTCIGSGVITFLFSLFFVFEMNAQHFECGHEHILPLEEDSFEGDSIGPCYNRERTCVSPDYIPFYQNLNSFDTAVIRLNFHFFKTGDYGLNFGPTHGNCDTCANNSGMNGYAVADSMLKMLNDVAKNLWEYRYSHDNSPALDVNGVPVPYIQDSRLRFELYEENGEGAVHFHEVEEYKYMVTYLSINRGEDCRGDQIEGPPQKPGGGSYSKYGSKVVDIYVYEEWFPVESFEVLRGYDSLSNPIIDTVYCRSVRGKLDGKDIDLSNMWWYWRANGGNYNTVYRYANVLFHEIGHLLSLPHTDSGSLCDAEEPNVNTHYNYSNNVMGYNNHQWALSPGQLDQMHNYIYRTKPDWVVTNYELGNYCNKLPGRDTITGHVVWDEDMEVNRDVLVRTGSKLEIEDACILFGYNVYIDVERGAQLIVRNAELGSGCTPVFSEIFDLNIIDRRWGGIRVQGNAGEEHPSGYTDPIYPGSPGRVVLLQSVIRDAKVAVSDNWTLTYSPDNWGGYLYAFGTRFRNCFKAVEFMSRGLLNNSKILSCRIDVSVASPLNSEGITIWDAHGIEIANNTFQHLSRNAVKTIDGGFTAKGNTFYKIQGSAIDVSAKRPVGNRNVVIGGDSAFDMNVFDNNPLGIRIDGYIQSQNLIFYNEFKSANLSVRHKAIEINRSLVNIQNNEFLNQYNGIGISASDNMRTEVKNNIFKNFSTGIHYQGINSNSQFACNSFQENQYAAVHVGLFRGIPDQGTVDFSNNNRWHRNENLDAPGALDIRARDSVVILWPDTTTVDVLSGNESFLYYVQENEGSNSIRRPKCNLSATLCSPGQSPLPYYRTKDSDLNRSCESIGTFTTEFDHLSIVAINHLLDSLEAYDTLYFYNNDYLVLSGVKYAKISDSLNYLTGIEDYTTANLLIDSEHKFDYRVLSYGLQLAEGDLLKAEAVLDDMEMVFAEEEALDYVEVQRINLKHLSDYTYIADSTEMIVLDEVAGKLSLAGSNARAMLTFWTDTIFAPILDHPVWDTVPPPLKEESYANSPEKRLTVYPNPGYGLFTLKLNFIDQEDNMPKEVRLYDMRGLLIDIRRYDTGIGGQVELDYRHCRPEVYILEVRSGRDVERTRLIIIN